MNKIYLILIAIKTLSMGSLEKAKKLTLNNRTSNILNFINSKMGMFDGKDNLIY
jgi:hypothetical protein